MEFAAPWLLVGVLGAAVPLLIHLLLRPRPMRVTFPAITFLHRKLAAGTKAQRVRNIWLLVVRGAWIACLSLLLAGPRCRSSPMEIETTAPTATVLLLDDSWSTQFHETPDRTSLDELRAAAASRARAVANDPPPSVVGLVFADESRLPEELTAEVGAVTRRLGSTERATLHARTLREGLRRAARMLRSANQSQRRLVVFSDGAAHAWRDIDPGVVADINGLTVEVVCALPHAGNLALTQVRPLRSVAIGGTGGLLSISLRCDGPATRVTVSASQRGRTLSTTPPTDLAADSSATLELALPPLPPGLHGIRLQIQPEDRLTPDQAAFVALDVGPRPRAVLVASPPQIQDDLSTIIFRNLLAPEGLARAEQAVDLDVIAPERAAESLSRATTSDRGGGTDSERAPQLIVLPGSVALPDAARDALRRSVESGATLLLAPGSSDDFAAWDGFREVLSGAVPRAKRLAGPIAATWESTPLSAIAIPLGGGQLEQLSVRRRIELANLADGTVVHIRGADGAPLLISHSLGRGRIAWLLTGPDPAWSEFGQRAANLLAILHGLLIDASGPPRVASVEAGHRADFEFPPAGRTLLVEKIDPVESGAPATISSSSPRDAWPTALPGLYSVRAAGANDPQSMYAVNWPAAESDPTPISAEQIARQLGVQQVRRTTLEDAGNAPGFSGAAAAWHIPPQRLIAIALIVLLALETIMSTRSGLAVSATKASDNIGS